MRKKILIYCYSEEDRRSDMNIMLDTFDKLKLSIVEDYRLTAYRRDLDLPIYIEFATPTDIEEILCRTPIDYDFVFFFDGHKGELALSAYNKIVNSVWISCKTELKDPEIDLVRYLLTTDDDIRFMYNKTIIKEAYELVDTEKGESDNMKSVINAIYGYPTPQFNINNFIDKVIFNDPATIVIWKDGTKTVVKANNEKFDPEKGFAMAIIKKWMGNKGNYCNLFKKYIPAEEIAAQYMTRPEED